MNSPHPDFNAALVANSRAVIVAAVARAVSDCWRVGARAAIFAGAGYLVFWRDQSGWLFLAALILAKFIK